MLMEYIEGDEFQNSQPKRLQKEESIFNSQGRPVALKRYLFLNKISFFVPSKEGIGQFGQVDYDTLE